MVWWFGFKMHMLHNTIEWHHHCASTWERQNIFGCHTNTWPSRPTMHCYKTKIQTCSSFCCWWYLLHRASFRLTCCLPHCHNAASQLQLSAATPLCLYHQATSPPSWIEVNCLQSAALGKAARLSTNWLDAAQRLVFPLRRVALVQLYKYHHQCGNAMSGKLVWKQH